MCVGRTDHGAATWLCGGCVMNDGMNNTHGPAGSVGGANRWGAALALLLAALIGGLSWQQRAPSAAVGPGEGLSRSHAVATTAISNAPTATSSTPAPREIAARHLSFEPNRGQAAKGVRWLSTGPRHQAAIFDDGVALTVPSRAGANAGVSPGAGASINAGTSAHASAQVRFVNARRGGEFVAREPAPGRSHHLQGNDSSRWLRDLPQYRQLRYAGLYRGIDLVWYSRDGELEFDLVVQPGADAAQIQLQINGAKAPTLADDGQLLLDGPGGALRLKRPVLYQHIDGRKLTLDAQWRLGAAGRVGLDLPAYDKRYPLVIDPVVKLLYSTYLGGVHDDQVGNLVLDAQGNAYIVGNSGSEDWPVSGNAYQTRRKNLGVYVRNIVVTKFDAAGTLLWSTFLGGSVNDYGSAIAIDAAGQVVIGGTTTSSDFPTTAGAHQTALRGGTNGFVAVLSPDGSTLVQSTLYGGTGTSGVNALALDSAGNVVIAGNAGAGLSTTAGAYKPNLATGTAAYVARFSPSTGGPLQLLAASYYGTDTAESNSSVTGNVVHGMTLDASGAPWIAGQAFTTRLPTTVNALQTAPTEIDLSCRNGVAPLNSFAYIARLSPDLKTLPFASYLSGKQRVPGQQVCSEFAISIKLDAAGDVYVHGGTGSDKFPTTAGTPQPVYPGNNGFTGYSAFITKLKGDVPRVLWSSYLGGNGGNTFAGRMALDAGTNSLWLPLVTAGGANFPLTADAQQKVYGGGVSDAALMQLDAGTGAIKYSSYMGGSGEDIGLAVAVDGGGNAFVAGTTTSRDLAVTGNAYQSSYTAGAFDGADWFFRIVGSGALSRIRPLIGGTGGDVTLSFDGVGIQAGSTCALSLAGSRVEGQNTLVAADGTSSICSVSLAGLVPGLYDISITNPDGTVLKRGGVFTVAAGGASSIEVDIVGTPVLRAGVPSDYQVNVRNTGTVDAYMVPVWLTLSVNMRYTIQVMTGDPATAGAALDDGAGLYGDPDPASAAERRRVPFILPRVAAGGVVALRLQAINPVTGDDFTLSIEPDLPWFETRQEALDAMRRYRDSATRVPSTCIDKPARPTVSDCFGLWSDLMGRVWAKVIPALPAGPDGLRLTEAQAALRLQQLLAKTLAGAIEGSTGTPSATSARRLDAAAGEGGRVRPTGLGPAEIIGGAIVSLAWYEAQWGTLVYGHGDMCTVLTTKPPGAIGQTLKPPSWDLETCKKGQRTRKLKLTFHCTPNDIVYEDDVDCPPEPDPDKPKKPKKKTKKGSAQGSKDPNDKFGPEGGGGATHPVSSLSPFGYQIAFENQATAGLAAADVVVSDQLDVTKYDLRTLTLGSISWGPHRISVPAGLNTYSSIFPINAAMSVRVAGSLNPSTGLLKWTFTTLDPLTKLPPSDPTLGFLPPNKNGTEGQGYVNFTVAPKAGLGDGTKWENFASIVFDRNAPILTPTWVNTLDTTAPFSRVATVVQKATGTDLDVSWSGSDAGSGVRRYTVYVSDNGGAFSAWQSNVTSTSATFTGAVIGHTYGFNVVAADGAGNVEATRLAADASVTVRDTTVVPPVTPPASGGGGCSIASGDQRDGSLPLLLAAGVLAWRRRIKAAAATGWRRTARG